SGNARLSSRDLSRGAIVGRTLRARPARGRPSFTNPPAKKSRRAPIEGPLPPEDRPDRALRRLQLEPLPLAAHPGEPERAQLELCAQPSQDGGLVPLVSGGDVIRSLPLLLEVDQVVGGVHPPQRSQSLGVDAGPEQREVADVAMALPPPAVVSRGL